tara:strand:- start:2975 stop:3712 length:738 start_codon:yes stop_codon:yes gene_type:complete
MSRDVRVWEEPIPEQTYVIGCDPAQGLAKGDDSVIQVIRMHTGDQVCEVQGKIDPIELGELCYTVGTWYNNALVGIENNQDGGCNRTLFNCGYRNIYFQQTNSGKPFDEASPKLGYHCNVRTRPHLVAQGRHHMQEGNVIPRSSALIAQFEIFAYNGTRFQAVSGGHDDLVMAWLLAIEMFVVQLAVDETKYNVLLPTVDGESIPEIGEEDIDVARIPREQRLTEQALGRQEEWMEYPSVMESLF